MESPPVYRFYSRFEGIAGEKGRAQQKNRMYEGIHAGNGTGAQAQRAQSVLRFPTVGLPTPGSKGQVRGTYLSNKPP